MSNYRSDSYIKVTAKSLGRFLIFLGSIMKINLGNADLKKLQFLENK